MKRELRTNNTPLVVIIFFIGILNFSCAGMFKPQPVDAGYISAVEGHINKYKFKSSKTLKTSHKKFIRKVRPGQWVAEVRRQKDGTNDVTLTIYRIISVKGNTVVSESESYSASGQAIQYVVQSTLTNYPIRGPLVQHKSDSERLMKQIKIVKSVVRVGNSPVQDRSEMGWFAEGMAKTIIPGLDTGTPKSKACKTKFLKSSSCVVYPYEASFLGMSAKGEIWGHSEVPIIGRIKMEDSNSTTETIAFGLSGAKSKL